MAITYFGNNTTPGDSNNMAGNSIWLTAGYACPGTGLQNVATLDANIQASSASNVRCAIYTAAGVFVAQWSAKQVPAVAGWLAGTSFVNIVGSPITPQLTGGNYYWLVVTCDGTLSIYYATVASGVAEREVTDYTGGFPASLSPSAFTWEVCVRCGVQPAGGGGPGILPYGDLLARMRRNRWQGWDSPTMRRILKGSDSESKRVRFVMKEAV